MPSLSDGTKRPGGFTAFGAIVCRACGFRFGWATEWPVKEIACPECGADNPVDPENSGGNKALC